MLRPRQNILGPLFGLGHEKGTRYILPERPEGCFAQIKPGPFFGPANWTARGLWPHRGRYRFTLMRHERPLAEVELRVPGRYNVLNALAAAALVWHEGVSPGEIAAGLGRFRGLRRRLEHRGTWQGATLLDDYAHHPAEISATLEAARMLADRTEGGRLVGMTSYANLLEGARRFGLEAPVGLVTVEEFPYATPEADLETLGMELMKQGRNAVPVLEDDRLVGLISWEQVARFGRIRREVLSLARVPPPRPLRFREREDEEPGPGADGAEGTGTA